MERTRIFEIRNLNVFCVLCALGLVTLIGGCICLLIIIASIITLKKIYQLIPIYAPYALHFFVLWALLAVLLFFVFALCTAMGVIEFRKRCHLFSLSLRISEDEVEIANSKTRFCLPSSDILHIYASKWATFDLVLNIDKHYLTLSIDPALFKADDFNEMSQRLTRFPQYTDNKKLIRQISKRFNLNNPFRKNRLEYKLSALQK